MKRLCKLFALFFTGITLLSGLVGCGGGKISLLEENLVDDAYDNYYEIFVYSFNDSDGDGIGDFKGVTQKLDYVRDMGFTGIWLMPICTSPSYHKYDVTNYKAVDSDYGSMEDFEELVAAAHRKGIKLIIDLVVNHTSNSHPWFEKFIAARKSGDTQSEYYDYYNYSSELKTGYTYFQGGYYESRFQSGMPDLNLDNEKVRAEISSVIEFWLGKGVDGFRLDACTSYYTNNTVKSAQFTDFLKTEAIKYNPDAYLVGEVWSDAGTIGEYYKRSGADSFFCFPTEGSAGFVNSAVNLSVSIGNASVAANSYFNSVNTVLSMANGHIPAPFLCNHDTGRAAGFLARDLVRIKFAYALLSLYSGNTFTYYGDEIGMTGSANDPDKRVGMRWSKDTKGIYPPGVTTRDEKNFYGFDSVEDQLKDENSILNFYKLCNNARNAIPALMRGSAERLDSTNENVLVFKKTYNGEAVVLAVNFANEESVVEGDYGTLKQGLCTSGSVKVSGGKITIPAFSVAIFS